MPWCAYCKIEYSNDFIKCPNCDVFLVPELPTDSNVDDPVPPDTKMDHMLLLSINDNMNEKLIINLLTDADIHFYKIDKGPRGYNKVNMGFSIYETDIYVDKNDYEKAKEIVDLFFAKPDDYVEPELLKDTDNRTYFVGKTVLRIAIGLIFLVGAFLTIVSLLSKIF